MKLSRQKFSNILLLIIAIVFIPITISVLYIVQSYERIEALEVAQSSADRMIERNLSIHRYFANELKPSVFALAGDNLTEGYFDARWMSSTFAIHTIQSYMEKSNEAGFYYKECAINARSPQNEADAFEREFLERSAKDPSMTKWSGVREIEGKPYFVVLRRGESMEDSCLLCHSEPGLAPKGLVERFGGKRSFGRKAGELVSAMSVRIPLASAFEQSETQGRKLVVSIAGLLALTLLLLYFMGRSYLERPLNKLREAVGKAEKDDALLGLPIETGGSREIQAVAEAFSGMSGRVKNHIDKLESEVSKRTLHLEEANKKLAATADELQQKNRALQEAMAQIRTLSGILPICASCKKIRNDQGYWEQVESYVCRHTDAQFSHGLCKECIKKLYPNLSSDLDE
jgi:hypothetical protein